MHPKIKRMVDGMAAKKKSRKPFKGGKDKEWFLYILRCKDGSFYTGVTNDLDKRVKTHN